MLKPITKEYIRRVFMLILLTVFSWMYSSESVGNYAYILIFLAVLYYTVGPKATIPRGAAYYTKSTFLDIMGFFFWTGIMIFFFDLREASAGISGGVVLFFLFLSIYPLYMLWLSVKFSSKWYLFDKDRFQWSDNNGIQSILTSTIAYAGPYITKKRRFSVQEMGLQIVTKSGKTIQIISNNLKTDEKFMKYLRDLYLEGDDTFASYLNGEEETLSDKDLAKLQKRMEENGKNIQV